MTSHQTKHLLLLVGGNPLPNAVAAERLTMPKSTISLLHSKGGFKVAQRLQHWIKSRNRCEPGLKEIDESDPASIFRGTSEVLLKAGETSVGLHYTGGTKAMSVHAYQAVLQWAEQQRKQGHNVTLVFSYLNPRKLQIVIDPLYPQSGERAQRIPVGLEPRLELKDLLDLHGWTLRNGFPITSPILPKSACALAQEFASSSGALKKWRDWLSSEPKPKEVNDIPPDFAAIKRALISEISEVGGKPRDWMGWLSSKWLEHHVLDVLNGLPDYLCLHECAQNIVPNEIEFDLDVVALRGYQLFAFSCGIGEDIGEDRKDKLKLKLFEAYVRARQLGGDEARSALVCFSDKPKKIEQEMRRDVGPEGQIRVFGRTHLARLSAHLTDWIKEQSKGA